MPQTVGYPKTLTKRVAQSIIQEVADAKLKLEHGQQYRKTKREDAWSRSEKQYEGKHWELVTGADVPDGDLMVVNMSFSTVNTIVPYMTGSNPNFIVVPYSGDATQRNAAVQQALLNRQWRSDRMAGQNELETDAVDFLIYGDGFMKVGFDIVTRRTGSNTFSEVADLWVQRVSPWDVWIDPTADGIHNARWVAQRMRLSRTELEASKHYSNTFEGNVSYDQSDMFDGNADEKERFVREVFDGTEYTAIYEFYDLVNMRKIVFADGELPLQYVEDIGQCPIVQMQNYRIPRSPYGMGELEQMWPLQQELNKTRTHMIQHRKRNAQKIAYRAGKLDQDAINSLTSSTVNEGIPIKGDEPIGDLIQPLQVPNLSGDVYNVSELMQRDIYEISGVNEYLRGATPEIRRTATEATIIEGASNVKSQFKLRQVEKLVRKVGTLLLAFAKDVYPQTEFDEIQLYLTGREAEKVARVDKPELVGSDVLVSPSPDIFVGEYEVEVEQASTELRNPVMREQKYRGMFIDLLPAMGALADMGVIVNIKKIMELWFEAAGIEDVDALFVPPAPQSPGLPPAAPTPQDAGGAGLGPADIPPDLLAGAFGPENTGILDPIV